MATAFELTHYNDPELQAFRDYQDREQSESSIIAKKISVYTDIVILLPIVFVAVTLLVLFAGEFSPFFGGLLAGSVAAIIVLLWARVTAKREERREDALWDRTAKAHAETVVSIDRWLADSYGVAIDDYWDTGDLVSKLFTRELKPTDTWTLSTAGGGKLEGRFLETSPGVIELRKATIADTDESVYFKPVLAAV